MPKIIKKRAEFITLAILFLFVTACNQAGKNTVGIAYYSSLQKTLSTAYNIDIKNNVVLFILHSDTLCSCNGKNIYLVNDIIKKSKGYRPIIILKDDYSHNIKNLISVKNAEFYTDTSSVLEKNGSVFRFDKIFVVKDGTYDNMFDMEDKDVKKIKAYFQL